MDQISLIEGVILTKLMTIKSPEGSVLRYLRHNDNGFNQFKESYFSTVNKDIIKPWKRHIKMSLNIAVPVGEIKFKPPSGFTVILPLILAELQLPPSVLTV